MSSPNESSGASLRSSREAGQALVVMVFMLSLFLVAVLAFAVDYTNIWLQRQQAQTAADAACEAGAMDIYQLASGVSLPNMGFALGTAGNCSSYSSSGPTMCWYANKNGLNGYSGGDGDGLVDISEFGNGGDAAAVVGDGISLPADIGLDAAEDILQQPDHGQPDADRGGKLHLRANRGDAGWSDHGAASHNVRVAEYGGGAR